MSEVLLYEKTTQVVFLIDTCLFDKEKLSESQASSRLSFFIARALVFFTFVTGHQCQWALRLFTSLQKPPLFRNSCKAFQKIDYKSYHEALQTLSITCKSPDLPTSSFFNSFRCSNILNNLTQAISDFGWNANWKRENELEGPDIGTPTHRLVLVSPFLDDPCLFFNQAQSPVFSNETSLRKILESCFLQPLVVILESLKESFISLVWICPYFESNIFSKLFLEFFQSNSVAFAYFEEFFNDFLYYNYPPFYSLRPLKKGFSQNHFPIESSSRKSAVFGTTISTQFKILDLSLFCQISLLWLNNSLSVTNIDWNSTFISACGFYRIFKIIPTLDGGLVIEYLLRISLENSLINSLFSYLNHHKSKCLYCTLSNSPDYVCYAFYFDSSHLLFTIYKVKSWNPSVHLEEFSLQELTRNLPCLTEFPNFFSFFDPYQILNTQTKELSQTYTALLEKFERSLCAFERDYQDYSTSKKSSLALISKSPAKPATPSKHRLKLEELFEELYKINSLDAVSCLSKGFVELIMVSELEPSLESFLHVPWTARENILKSGLSGLLASTRESQLPKGLLYNQSEIDYAYAWIEILSDQPQNVLDFKTDELIYREIQIRLLILGAFYNQLHNVVKNYHEELEFFCSKIHLYFIVHSSQGKLFSIYIKKVLKPDFENSRLLNALIEEEAEAEEESRLSTLLTLNDEFLNTTKGKRKTGRSLFKSLQSFSLDCSNTWSEPKNNKPHRGFSGIYLQSSIKEMEICRSLPSTTKKKRKAITPHHYKDQEYSNDKTLYIQNKFHKNGNTDKSFKSSILILETPTKNRTKTNFSTRISPNASPKVETDEDEEVIIVETPKKLLRTKRILSFDVSL